MKIIAEVGSNWEVLEDCVFSIKKAKESGADAVKFQYFNAKELYGPKAASVYHEMPDTWLPILKDYADKNYIEFMCTAFSPEGYREVDPFVNVHKIASSEMNHPGILQTVKQMGKPAIVSTAGFLKNEIHQAVVRLKDIPVTVLYCVGDYPAKLVDFRHLEALRDYMGPGYAIGYSDHSNDVMNIPRLAKQHGATVIEKHVDFIGLDTPDSPHSLNQDEFRLMCLNLRSEVSPDETWLYSNNKMRSQYHRRLVTTKPVKPLETFGLGRNVEVYRGTYECAKAISPFDSHLVEGKRCKRAVNEGHIITLDDLS